jgi:hypothetical protein
MRPLWEDRAFLRKRFLAAFTEIQRHLLLMQDKIAIIGCCFWGGGYVR